MKLYEILVSVLLLLFLAALSLDGCNARAAETPVETSQPPELPGDPPPSPECLPYVGSDLVIAPCIDENEGSTEWATTVDGFIGLAAWEDLITVQAIAVYCDYASPVVVPYRRVQVPAWLSDGQVSARCDGASFVHFFPGS
jgi:hypothetical protein